MANRYLLGKQLGAGGTSRVHAALDERLGRQVAIKLLDAQLVASADPAGRERFLREGPTSASFSHRNAVTVFDAGEDAGDLYIVMELVDGPSLAAHMARTGPLPIDEAVGIATQVLAALGAAHAVGIVHRDVKPANVLLGSDGDVKLADFGIAKRFDDLDESVTTTGTVIGTPRYLAPEQATGAPATPATDIYASGILLFEMLTGHPPFAGGSLAAVAVVQQSQPAPDVRSLRREVTAQLAATVARALATKPGDRFSSASEMSAELVDADATQLMDAADLPAVVARSGDTKIMPQPVAVGQSPLVAVATVRRTSKTRPVMIAVALVMAVVGVAALLSGRDDTTKFVAATGAASDTSTAGDTTTTAPDVLGSAITESPSPTELPTTSAVDEIIPGFPRTDDLETFLLQLEEDPALVGQSGEDLAIDLRRLFDENSRKKQRDQSKALQEQMTKWVDDETLNEAIAEELEVLLEEFVD